MVWEPLVGLDDALAPVPALAESWQFSADGTVWTFKLRPGVRFSDGTPFDADVVVTNLERYVRLSPRPAAFFTLDVSGGYGKLIEVKKVDPLTVTFHLGEPAPAMPSTMSNFFSAMFQPAGFADDGGFKGMPVATGPFKMVDWQREQYVALERNDDYRGPKPHVRRVRLRTIPDGNARVSALLAGEVDAVGELGALLPAQAQQLKNQPGITVGADPISITQYLAFNCSKPPFDDVRLRRAVALATDLNGLVRDLLFGYATPGKSLLSPFSKQWFSPKGTPSYDPAEARRLASEALGARTVAAVFPFSISAGQSRPSKAIAELLQSQLRPLGIEVTLQALENAALTDVTNRGEWNLRFQQQGWANGDPDFIFANFVASTGRDQARQRGGYRNPLVDDLISQAKSERDEKRRFALYERLQELSVQDMPTLALYHEHAPYAYRDTLTGFRQRVTYQPTLDTIKLVK
jgi:peptide/nickel transport system substrate-binding protein